jgi:hypothetical protein
MHRPTLPLKNSMFACTFFRTKISCTCPINHLACINLHHPCWSKATRVLSRQAQLLGWALSASWLGYPLGTLPWPSHLCAQPLTTIHNTFSHLHLSACILLHTSEKQGFLEVDSGTGDDDCCDLTVVHRTAQPQNLGPMGKQWYVFVLIILCSNSLFLGLCGSVCTAFLLFIAYSLLCDPTQVFLYFFLLFHIPLFPQAMHRLCMAP